MAGEVGHVVYGARLLTYLGDKVKTPAYWAGTLFPDIRHLGVVSRHRTHPEQISLSTLVGSSDWHTGLRVHSWVDVTREHFLRQAHIKEVLPWHPFVPHALKLIEDEFLYDHFDDWNLISRVLNQVYAESLNFVSARERIQDWHRILQDYFAHPPDPASRHQLSINIGLSAASADEINNVVAMLKKHPMTKKLFDQFILHLEEILK